MKRIDRISERYAVSCGVPARSRECVEPLSAETHYHTGTLAIYKWTPPILHGARIVHVCGYNPLMDNFYLLQN